MKRTTAFILLVVFALSLCACNKGPSKEAKAAIVGEWRSTSGYYYIFNEDCTGVTSEGEEFDWNYDEENQAYTITLYTGKTLSSPIHVEKGLRFLEINNLKTYHKDDLLKLIK